MWLDIFFDKLIDFLLIFSLTISVFYETKETIYLIIGLGIMGIIFFNQFIMLLNDTYFKVSRDNNISDEYKTSLSKVLFYKFIFSSVTLFRTILLFSIIFFINFDLCFFDVLQIGMIFILFHGAVLILSVFIVQK